MRKDINIFYHLFTLNDWEDILNYHINELLENKLYTKCNNLFIGVVYIHDNDLIKLNNIIEKYSKIVIINKRKYNILPVKTLGYEYNVEPGEGETIFKMIEFAKSNKNKSNYLFFHSKGVSKPNDKQRLPHLPIFISKGLNLSDTEENIRLFILKDMTNSVIKKWEEIVELLNVKSFYYYMWNFFWISDNLLLKFNAEDFKKYSEFGNNYGKGDGERHFTAIFPVNLYESISKIKLPNKRFIAPISI